MNPLYVIKQFPMVPQFLALMKQFDPDGKFRDTQGESWYHKIDEALDKGSDYTISDESQNSLNESNQRWAEIIK